MFKEAKVFTVILVIGVLAALVVLASRFSIEQRNMAVELVVDYAEMRQLATAAAKPLDYVLGEFKKAGVTGVAVEVDTVGSLLDSGNAELLPSGDTVTLVATNPNIKDRLHKALDGYISKTESGDCNTLRFEGQCLRVDVPYLRNIPVGIDPQAVKTADLNQLSLVARITNYPGIDEATVRNVLTNIAEQGAKTVIFGGDQVLGFRGLMDVTADLFEGLDLSYGSVEFGKQKGDTGISKRLEDRMIRVHSIPQAEMAQLSKSSAIERYTRAARERNIRLAYIRLFDIVSDDPVTQNTEFIRQIASSLRHYGLEPKLVHFFGDPAPIAWLLVLLGAGAAAGVGLLLSSIITLSLRSTIIWALFGTIVLGGLAASSTLGLKLVALLTAIVFPTLAVMLAGRGSPSTVMKKYSIGMAIWKYLAVAGITASGGLIIAALLSKRSFMLKIDQFAGVKLAHLLPLLFVLCFYVLGVAWQRGTWSEQRQRAAEALRNLFSKPLLIWQAVALLFVLVIVALVLARSGNEPGVGVSSFELKARALLDQILYVRPRTKELLFGHPLLFLGIIFALSGRRSWAVPLIVLGTIGQVSLINTFCHIHTPIFLSVLRVVIGAILGLVTGLILYWLVLKTKILEKEESQ